MPLVICSRCHRNIPERDLGSHMNSHRGKTSPYAVSRGTQRIDRRSQEQRFSSQSLSVSMVPRLPVRSNVSQNWVDKTFRQILDEMSVSVNSVEVVVDSSELEAQVSFDQTRHVKLEYRNRFFRTLTEDEIVSVLSHEACYVAILPHTLYFGGPSDFVDWQSTFIDIFDEFLAHEEFYSSFKDTPTLSEYNQ